jgi:hypothetical protein
VRSSAWPSSLKKEEAEAWVKQRAEAATPNFDNMIEHNTPLAFPMVMSSSLVRGIDTPALAFSETVDALGVMCWLFKEQMLAKINAGLDEVADDKAALSQQQREEMEAQISSDMLAIERAECALIWHAEANGEVIDFRSDTSPMAVLGVRLVTAPRANPSPGTSPQHVAIFGGAR